MNQMTPDNEREPELQTPQLDVPRITTLVAAAVVFASITGYYIGVNSPNPVNRQSETPNIAPSVDGPGSANTVPATTYADFHIADIGPNADWVSNFQNLKQEPYDPFAVIQLSAQEKRNALQARAGLRAFNGAPPMVPHPITQMKSDGCTVCHGDGIRTSSLRVPKMSHAFLDNCTQCHLERKSPLPTSDRQFENSFVGLPAPSGGARAFDLAPPVIPHSTWMRSDCLSCHGRTGQAGLQTTHPWRTNCTQCHAPSAVLEQVTSSETPHLLPPPTVNNSNE